MLGGIGGQEEKGTTMDEMVRWHHQFNGHEFEEAPGVGNRQGSLACCSPWGRRESDTTERLTPALAGGFFTTEPPEKPSLCVAILQEAHGVDV